MRRRWPSQSAGAAPSALACAALACAAALCLAVACGSGPKAQLGDPCEDDESCASGLCYEGMCLDPQGDEDGDGLLNGTEVALGTNPFARDTDDDGVDDPEEVVSTSSPADADGDGKIDAIESRVADADGDCLTDQFDPVDDKPADDLPGLVDATCPADGVCAEAAERRVRCVDGVARCVLDAVPGHEADETTCDGLDNDCDGVTDDTNACDVDDPCLVGRCDGANGCVTDLREGACNDDNACTTGDRCEEGVCRGAADLDCDDGNPCTDDTCDPAAGCRTANNTAPCDDADPCTSGDVCAGGVCAGFAVTFDCEALGVDDDCDGYTDEDCVGNLEVRAFESSGGETRASDGVYGMRARVEPTPFHAAGGHSTDGVFVLMPGLPFRLGGAAAPTNATDGQ